MYQTILLSSFYYFFFTITSICLSHRTLPTRNELHWKQILHRAFSVMLRTVACNSITQSSSLNFLHSCMKTRITEKTLMEFFEKYKIFIKSLWNIYKGNKKLILLVITYGSKSTSFRLGDTASHFLKDNTPDNVIKKSDPGKYTSSKFFSLP